MDRREGVSIMSGRGVEYLEIVDHIGLKMYIFGEDMKGLASIAYCSMIHIPDASPRYSRNAPSVAAKNSI